MNKSHAYLAAVAACALGLSGVAHAQDGGWWTISVAEQERALEKPASGADKVRAFAMCAVRTRPAAIEALLATPRDTNAEKGASRRAMAGANDCLPLGYLDLKSVSVRGAFAEAMFWTRYSTINVGAAEFAARRPSDPSLQFGMCTVATNAPAVRALSGTRPGSAEETQQFAALQPAFETCLSAGATIGEDKPALRSILSQALYQAAASAGPVRAQ